MIFLMFSIEHCHNISKNSVELLNNGIGLLDVARRIDVSDENRVVPGLITDGDVVDPRSQHSRYPCVFFKKRLFFKSPLD